jgi:pimeloyl-ACP methyl ester carboxylesterase
MTTTTEVIPTQEVTIGDTLSASPANAFHWSSCTDLRQQVNSGRSRLKSVQNRTRVIRINLPGHGASPSPASRSYRIEDFVEDVARVFQHLSIDRTVLIFVGVTALSLALAVATPAFAGGHRGVRAGGVMYVGSGGPRVTQARAVSVVSSADAAYCRQRWAYYDSTSGEYMDDNGHWRPCP